jgi:hypothetical protein
MGGVAHRWRHSNQKDCIYCQNYVPGVHLKGHTKAKNQPKKSKQEREDEERGGTKKPGKTPPAR